MKRPFLDQPEAWTRASRTDQTAVDAAYAIERQLEKSVEPHEWFLLILVASVTAAIVLGVM